VNAWFLSPGPFSRGAGVLGELDRALASIGAAHWKGTVDRGPGADRRAATYERVAIERPGISPFPGQPRPAASSLTSPYGIAGSRTCLSTFLSKMSFFFE
jgi:hypothetical protein